MQPTKPQKPRQCAVRVKAKETRRRIKPLYFVSGNENKVRETGAILKYAIPKLEAVNIDLPELQGDSPEDISKEKCRIAVQKASDQAGKPVPVLVEDTSLCFNALEGLPGPYIKWFLQKLGHDGLNKLLAGHEDKSAYALCVFSYCDDPKNEPITFSGRCAGTIVPPRGQNTFGWDTIFQPAGFDVTFSEMSKETKNTISHRTLALEQFQAFINSQPELLLGDVVDEGQFDQEWDIIDNQEEEQSHV